MDNITLLAALGALRRSGPLHHLKQLAGGVFKPKVELCLDIILHSLSLLSVLCKLLFILYILECGIDSLLEVLCCLFLLHIVAVVFYEGCCLLTHLCEHLHGEYEGTATILTGRLHIELASVRLNQLLTDHESHADTLRVLLGRALQLSEHAE